MNHNESCGIISNDDFTKIKIIMNNKFNAYCRIEPVKEYTTEDIKKIRKKNRNLTGVPG